MMKTWDLVRRYGYDVRKCSGCGEISIIKYKLDFAGLMKHKPLLDAEFAIDQAECLLSRLHNRISPHAA